MRKIQLSWDVRGIVLSWHKTWGLVLSWCKTFHTNITPQGWQRTAAGMYLNYKQNHSNLPTLPTWSPKKMLFIHLIRTACLNEVWILFWPHQHFDTSEQATEHGNIHVRLQIKNTINTWVYLWTLRPHISVEDQHVWQNTCLWTWSWKKAASFLAAVASICIQSQPDDTVTKSDHANVWKCASCSPYCWADVLQYQQTICS
jgi:hypothetical protein